MFLTVKKNYVWLERYKNRAKTGRGGRADVFAVFLQDIVRKVARSGCGLRGVGVLLWDGWLVCCR